MDEDPETGLFKISVAGEFPEIKINPEIIEEYKKHKETRDFIRS